MSRVFTSGHHVTSMLLAIGVKLVSEEAYRSAIVLLYRLVQLHSRARAWTRSVDTRLPGCDGGLSAEPFPELTSRPTLTSCPPAIRQPLRLRS